MAQNENQQRAFKRVNESLAKMEPEPSPKMLARTRLVYQMNGEGRKLSRLTKRAVRKYDKLLAMEVKSKIQIIEFYSLLELFSEHSEIEIEDVKIFQENKRILPNNYPTATLIEKIRQLQLRSNKSYEIMMFWLTIDKMSAEEAKHFLQDTKEQLAALNSEQIQNAMNTVESSKFEALTAEARYLIYEDLLELAEWLLQDDICELYNEVSDVKNEKDWFRYEKEAVKWLVQELRDYEKSLPKTLSNMQEAIFSTIEPKKRRQ